MMNDKVQTKFNDQINAELFSSYLYLSMSAYFESVNLKGFANWMRVQAQEEVVHAMKFYTHIVERGGRVSLARLEEPKNTWDSPLSAFEDAYGHERKITALINDLVDLAIAERDHAANAFLQWFVTEQIEEEASTDEVAQKLKLIGGASHQLLMLDNELGQRVFTMPQDTTT